jgi:transcriptional regulator with XRE-family HTH domain
VSDQRHDEFVALLRETFDRTAYGISQQEAAHLLGVSRNTLGKWCRGQALIPRAKLELLGAVVGDRIPPARIDELIERRRELDVSGPSAPSSPADRPDGDDPPSSTGEGRGDAGTGEPAAEARVMTFLASDVARWAGGREPPVDAVAAAAPGHLALVEHVVADHGGTLCRRSGTATLAVFATATAALQAAVAVRQGAAGGQRGSTPLTVRLGVYSGEVVGRDGEWHGRALTHCVRLRDRARPDAILVGQATALLVELDRLEGYGLDPRGRAFLAGTAQREQVYELTRLVRIRGRGADPGNFPRELEANRPARLVGRESGLDALNAALRAAERGPAQLALVLGEAGIGKTALAATWAHRAARRPGTFVLFGRCDREITVPFEPFTTALAPLAAQASVELLDRLDLVVGASAGPSRAASDTGRMGAFHAVTELLASAARRHRIILVLDDVHWAARPALLLLRHLAGQATEGLLIVATARDTRGDLSSRAVTILSELRLRPATTVIHPSPLDAGEVRALVRERDGADAIAVDQLVARSGGNPFLIDQILTAAGSAPDGDVRSMAGGLEGALAYRLAGLTGETRKVLRVAAVAGQRFTLAVVEKACDAEVIDELDEAVGAGVLREVPEDLGCFEFVHGLIRDAALGELSAARRARLHRRVGEAVEELHPLPPEPAPEDDGCVFFRGRYSVVVGVVSARTVNALAHHYLEAVGDGRAARAAEAAFHAARYALALGALDDAGELADRGLAAARAVEPPDVRAVVRLLLVRREASLESGDATRAAADEDAAVAACATTDDPVPRAWVGIALAGSAAVGDPDVPRALCEQARAGLAGRDTSLGAAVLGSLALTRGALAGEGSGAAPLAEEALAMARRVGDETTQLLALWQLGTVLSGDPTSLPRRQEIVAEMGRLIGHHTNYVARFLDLQLAAVLALQRGRGEELDHTIDRCLHRLQQVGELGWPAAFAAMARAVRALMAGRFDEVRADAELMVAAGGSDPAVRLNALQLEVRAAFEEGRFDGCLDAVRALRAGSRRPAAPTALLAALALHAGADGEAREAYDALARHRFATLDRDPTLPATLAYLTEVSVVTGTAGDRRALRELLSPYRGLQVVVPWGAGCLGAADRYLGMLLAADGLLDDAVLTLEAAIGHEDRLGAPALATRSRLWLARAVAARGGPANRRRAGELAARVVGEATAMGMAPVAEAASALV